MARFKYLLFAFIALLTILQTECGRSSSGGSRSSGSHSTSHSHSSPSHTSHSSGTSHSSPGGGTHSSFGGSSHTPSGGGSHTFGSGTHTSLHPSGSGSHAPSGSGSNTFGSGNNPSGSFGSHPSAPSAPHLPGYTVTGGSGFVQPSGGNKPIGFDHVNQQAHSAKPPTPGGIGFDQHQQTHNTGLNSANPGFSHNAPPGYTVTGGTPIGPKPGGIGFDHVNQQAHAGPPGYTVQGGAPLPKPGPIGFDHVNQQSHNTGRPVTPPSATGGITPRYTYPQQNYPGSTGFNHANQQPPSGVHHTYQPYTPHTVVQPSGYVHYQPPVQLQYSPPIVHHTTHILPVYQPSVIQTYSSGGGSLLSHGGSFLGGYLIGRLTSPSYGSYHTNNGYGSTHVTNNYYNNNGNSGGGVSNTGMSTDTGTTGNNYNSYYTVHHYHQNRQQVPTKFSVPGEDLTQCQGNTTEQLCVPNTNAFCLKNGTIMCTTPSLLTVPCGQNSTDSCVYSRIDCNGNPACAQSSNQTYFDFYLPCISNVTYLDNKVLDSTANKAQGSYELCVTAIAHPKKLESPVGSLSNLFVEFGKWQFEQFNEINNQRNSPKR